MLVKDVKDPCILIIDGMWLFTRCVFLLDYFVVVFYLFYPFPFFFFLFSYFSQLFHYFSFLFYYFLFTWLYIDSMLLFLADVEACHQIPRQPLRTLQSIGFSFSALSKNSPSMLCDSFLSFCAFRVIYFCLFCLLYSLFYFISFFSKHSSWHAILHSSHILGKKRSNTRLPLQWMTYFPLIWAHSRRRIWKQSSAFTIARTPPCSFTRADNLVCFVEQVCFILWISLFPVFGWKLFYWTCVSIVSRFFASKFIATHYLVSSFVWWHENDFDFYIAWWHLSVFLGQWSTRKVARALAPFRFLSYFEMNRNARSNLNRFVEYFNAVVVDYFVRYYIDMTTVFSWAVMQLIAIILLGLKNVMYILNRWILRNMFLFIRRLNRHE
jgi:hypothetical protein